MSEVELHSGGPVIEGEVVDQEEVSLPERPDLPAPARAEPVPLPWDLATIERRPVVATWLRNSEQRAKAARWGVAYAWHLVAFHALRVPLYLLRAAVFIPRGCLRITGRVAGWATDARSVPLILAAQRAGDAKEYRALLQASQKRARPRLLALAVGLLAVVVAVLVLWWWGPWWMQAAVVLAAAFTAAALAP